MKRKLIKQGVGLTVYLPKKWVDKNKLEKGDSVKIAEKEEGLIIVPQGKKGKKQEIKLNVSGFRESTIRTSIINAYRAGYDILKLKFEGKKEELVYIKNKFIIGFELFEIEDKEYRLESISEPSYDNFKKMISRQFYLLKEITRNIFKKDITDMVHEVQKYDNFLKRCISKKVLQKQGNVALWQFLSNLTQIARICYHFRKNIIKKNIKSNKIIKNTLQKVIEMIEILREGYANKDIEKLMESHTYEEKLVRNPSKEILGLGSLPSYFLLDLIRTTYLANSPLTSLIQFEEHHNSSQDV